jgi:sugar phosphate isomerase/epimerase
MNRRHFLQLSAGAGAALAAGGASASALAASGWATGGDASATDAALGKVDIYSRHLQWLRSPDEVAEAAKEMGYDGVDITVRPYPGHVDPAKVKTDLPPFVKAIRSHGVLVRAITCPITDADSPHAEEILQAASELDIRNYWWGTFHYMKDKSVWEQLDALKPRVAKLAALNAKYNMTAMYHLYAGSTEVGGPMWDLLYVLRDFDPAQVGLHYDLAHMTSAGDLGTWRTSLRAAGPYVKGMSVKDSLIVKTPDGQWSPKYVPQGEGEVELREVFPILREIGFTGPVEMQPEYENGGAQDAADKLTWPRKKVLDNMAKDLKVYRAALAAPPLTRDTYLPDGVPYINKPFAQMGGNPTPAETTPAKKK